MEIVYKASGYLMCETLFFRIVRLRLPLLQEIADSLALLLSSRTEMPEKSLSVLSFGYQISY